MNDEFNKTLWGLGEDSPELQRAIAKSMEAKESKRGYSIPTLTLNSVTEELEDIHVTAFTDVEDPEQRDRLVNAIKKVDSMTVGELARVIGYGRVALILKEAKGEELTEQEKTLRDIDITSLALTAVYAPQKVIGHRKPLPKEWIEKHRETHCQPADTEAD